MSKKPVTRGYPWFDRYWREPDRIPLLVLADGAVVGLCLIRVMDAGWTIAEFGIRPEARRQGIGLLAVEALADRASAEGARHLRADVHLWNERARTFWRTCGFDDTAEQNGVVTTLRPL